ncbi:MAG TPA: cation:proton antiporter [Candidatus Limnocylindrales bacterium]|nr:cation:proton antiporter [Candidatus Limnocylindrales bacterium]
MDATAAPILELGLVLLLAAAAGWVARRVGLPAVVGYLAVGVAISPFTPGYVADRQQLQLLADVGVVLLLFEVGIEVDIARLRREHSGLIWAAPVQTVVTTVLGTVAGIVAGLPPFGAGLIGLGVALSSSVVIVNITRSRRRTTTRDTEEALLGWSVLQDVTGVILAIVLLAAGGGINRPLPLALAGMAAFAALAVAGAAVLPRVLRRLGTDHDLFLIVSVASGLAIAGMGAVVAEMPLALAAFVAGLAITESPESSEARRRLLPFRDLLAVLFFVAIGTLIDPSALSRGLGWVLFVVVLVVVAKVGVAWLLSRLAGLRADPLQLAVGLGQIGEFSFVLASVGLAARAIAPEVYAAVLASVAITIVASTVVVRVVGKEDRALA